MQAPSQLTSSADRCSPAANNRSGEVAERVCSVGTAPLTALHGQQLLSEARVGRRSGLYRCCLLWTRLPIASSAAHRLYVHQGVAALYAGELLAEVGALNGLC